MRRLVRELVGNRKAATAVEYGLIVSLVVIAMIASLKGVADTTTTMWNNIHEKVQSASGG
jgi:pilus assembly protein Flp/PilA